MGKPLLQSQKVVITNATGDLARFNGLDGIVKKYDEKNGIYEVTVGGTRNNFLRSNLTVSKLITLEEVERKRMEILEKVNAVKRNQKIEESKPQKIDIRFGSFIVEPKPSEANDRNFPNNLHAACQLFCMTGNLAQAKQCKKDVDTFLTMLEHGPDGKCAHTMGRACCCWLCGHVGIPKNIKDCATGQDVAGICGKCNSDAQTNFVQLVQRQGTTTRKIPWMQLKSRASADVVAAAKAAEENTL